MSSSTSNNAARENMLEKIRQQLSGVPIPTLPDPESRRLAQTADVNVLAVQFQKAAEGIGVQFFDNVHDALHGLNRVAVSDSGDLPIALDEVDLFEGWHNREDLLNADAGLTSAQIAIAESGTLVLLGNQERHRLVSLVPPIHICLLRRKNIVGTMSEALTQIQSTPKLSPLVTFVTGPSRTADIELQLVLGVHGPRELRVVLI